MTNLNIQQGQNIEIVSAEVIKKLYETALSVPTPSEGEQDDAYMSGNLQVDKTYRTYVSYLTTRFPDLHINVTTSYYIPFEDSNVQSVLMANNISSDGIGITEADAATANLGTIFKNNTTITSFNQFKYFTRANTSPVNEMFRGCTNLSSIDLSEVTSFPEGCFWGCTNLQNVDYDFTNCTNLASRCFQGCGRFDVVALTQVVNDSNAANMDHSCFQDASITQLYLPKIEIPKDNSTNYSQDEWNFLSRTNIGILYFKQLRKMYPGWFRLSTVQKLVINNTTPPQWCYPNDASTYSQWYENKTLCLAKDTRGSSIIYCTNDIYVPDSAVSTYQADANWSAVAQYIKPISNLQTVATKAMWNALPAADKPNTLIEEYM